MAIKDAQPCPFCGKLPLAVKLPNNNWDVFCGTSECMRNNVRVEHVTKQIAIDVWNFRAKRGY